MFRALLCPLSGAYQLQQQPLVYRRNVVVAGLLVVVGPVVCECVKMQGPTNPRFLTHSLQYTTHCHNSLVHQYKLSFIYNPFTLSWNGRFALFSTR
jgi:hypothetical protein